MAVAAGIHNKVGEKTRKSPLTAHLQPPWPKGISGNPKGRPLSSRNKINEMFLRDLQTVWEEKGIASLRALPPVELVKTAASLIPQKFETDTETKVYVIADRSIGPDEWAAIYAQPDVVPTAGSTDSIN